MDRVIEALMVVSLFAVAHERVVEMIRQALKNLALKWPEGPWASMKDALTIGSLNVLTSTAFSLATNANALLLFHDDPNAKDKLEFFTYFVWKTPVPGGFWNAQTVVGCILMGFGVALGSKFWHDLAFGLMDLRTKLTATKEGAAPPPLTPPEAFIQPAAE